MSWQDMLKHASKHYNYEIELYIIQIVFNAYDC